MRGNPFHRGVWHGKTKSFAILDTQPDRLDFWACFFLKSSSYPVYQTTTSENGSDFTTAYNLTCDDNGQYISKGEYGPMISIILVSLILILSIFGIICNIFNVIVLRKSFLKRRHFKESIVWLAVVELMLSVATFGFTLYTIIIWENYDRGYGTMFSFLGFRSLFNVTKTIALETTIIITLERCMLLGFPTWFNKLYDKLWKSRVSLLSVVGFSILRNLNSLCGSTIVANNYEEFGGEYSTASESPNYTSLSVPSMDLMEFPYLLKRTSVEEIEVFTGMGTLRDWLLGFYYVLPLILLILSNWYLINKVSELERPSQGTILTIRQTRDLKASNMFMFVGTVLIWCEWMIFSILVAAKFQETCYVEIFLLQILFVAVAASTNFIVYYRHGPGFQKEFWNLMGSCCGGDRFGCIRWRWRNQEPFMISDVSDQQGANESLV